MNRQGLHKNFRLCEEGFLEGQRALFLLKDRLTSAHRAAGLTIILTCCIASTKAPPYYTYYQGRCCGRCQKQNLCPCCTHVSLMLKSTQKISFCVSLLLCSYSCAFCKYPKNLAGKTSSGSSLVKQYVGLRVLQGYMNKNPSYLWLPGEQLLCMLSFWKSNYPGSIFKGISDFKFALSYVPHVHAFGPQSALAHTAQSCVATEPNVQRDFGQRSFCFQNFQLPMLCLGFVMEDNRTRCKTTASQSEDSADWVLPFCTVFLS